MEISVVGATKLIKEHAHCPGDRDGALNLTDGGTEPLDLGRGGAQAERCRENEKASLPHKVRSAESAHLVLKREHLGSYLEPCKRQIFGVHALVVVPETLCVSRNHVGHP